MSKSQAITFASGLGYFQVGHDEYGTGAKGVMLDRIIFTTISGAATLDIDIGFTSAAVTPATVATAGAATRTATILATRRIVPGTVVLEDTQGTHETWTDNGDGTMTPAGTGSVEVGQSGTINYMTGAVSLVYAGNPGAISLDYNAYSMYVYARLASAASGVNPAIIINEHLPLFGRGEVLVFTASGGTPYATVRYTPTSSL